MRKQASSVGAFKIAAVLAKVFTPGYIL